ncbi:MAG: DNA polymerase-3 subunit delta' [Bacteroidia bacterium]|jgi:DNA polymerase-3 subunit delta'
MTFSDIIGKETEKALLLKRASNHAIPHAQLFVGKPGCGKLAIVLAMVQYMLCEQKQADDSCGKCKACVKMSKLIHPDVHFSFPVISQKSGSKPISNDFMETWRSSVLANSHLGYIDWMNAIGAENKQGNITKDECRSIIQKLSLKPFESKEKVLIMWLPEYLGKEGNSLLKLIEEPPDNTYFFLISENPDAVLPTILSRTQLTHIKPYKTEEMKQYLASNYSDIDIEAIAFLANGNIQAAQHFTAHTDDNITESFKTWMRHSFRRDVPKLMAWSDEMGGKGRENIKNFLSYSLGIIREILAYKTIPNYQIRLNKEEQQFVTKFSGVVQFANIEVLYKGLNDCIGQIERNANPKLTLFQLSLLLRDSFYETQKA